MKPRKVRIMLDITTEVPLGDIRKAREISLGPCGKHYVGQYLGIDQIQAKVIPSVEPRHIKVAKKKGGIGDGCV